MASFFARQSSGSLVLRQFSWDLTSEHPARYLVVKHDPKDMASIVGGGMAEENELIIAKRLLPSGVHQPCGFVIHLC